MGNICFFGCASNKVVCREIKLPTQHLDNEFDIEVFNPEFLGDGVSAKTFRVNIDNVNLTCKKIKRKYKEDFKNEIKVLNELRNQSYYPIFYKAIENKNFCYIMYDFIEGMDLFKMIQTKSVNYKNKEVLANIIKNITLGLQQLFKFNYVHLDLKLENIIINPHPPYNIKIIDVAFAKRLDNGENKVQILGTKNYISPEVLLYNRYFHNTDIWSLGIIVYILITERHLFRHNKNYNFLDQMKAYIDLKDFSPEYSKIKEYDEDLCDLLSKMLVKNQPFRICIKDVIKHRFLVNNS